MSQNIVQMLIASGWLRPYSGMLWYASRENAEDITI